MIAYDKLNDLVDECDSDANIPNTVFVFQTADRIRIDHPNGNWFHLIDLILNLGKIKTIYEEPQWAVVGDTFTVGYEAQKGIVYSDTNFSHHSGYDDERYKYVIRILNA